MKKSLDYEIVPSDTGGLFNLSFSFYIDTSYGFRPNRSCHDALKKIDKIIMIGPVNFVVDMDISKFFDTVNHKRLMECLKQRIVDSNLLQLISRILKSGIMEEGVYCETDQGTPHGGVLGPILANVYLHYAHAREQGNMA